MKGTILAALLLHCTSVFGATEKNDPSSFTVNVHVVSSASEVRCVSGFCHSFQVLETTIDGQPSELTTVFSVTGLLAIADYPGRVTEHSEEPRHAKSYDVYRAYELLLPDGSTRKFLVTRLGPAPASLTGALPSK